MDQKLLNVSRTHVVLTQLNRKYNLVIQFTFCNAAWLRIVPRSISLTSERWRSDHVMSVLARVCYSGCRDVATCSVWKVFDERGMGNSWQLWTH